MKQDPYNHMILYHRIGYRLNQLLGGVTEFFDKCDRYVRIIH